jgi:hypothetical protein
MDFLLDGSYAMRFKWLRISVPRKIIPGFMLIRQ